MQTLILELSDNDAQKFSRLVQEEKTPLEIVFVKAMNAYFYKKNVQKIRRSLKLYAEKIGINDEQALFNDVS